MKYFACFGPQFSFLISAKRKISGSGLLYADRAGTTLLTYKNAPVPMVFFNGIINQKRDLTTVNAGVQGGLGIQYPFIAGNIFAEYRTIIGITNINTKAEAQGKSQTGSLAFAIGYFIKIK